MQGPTEAQTGPTHGPAHQLPRRTNRQALPVRPFSRLLTYAAAYPAEAPSISKGHARPSYCSPKRASCLLHACTSLTTVAKDCLPTAPSHATALFSLLVHLAFALLPTHARSSFTPGFVVLQALHVTASSQMANQQCPLALHLEPRLCSVLPRHSSLTSPPLLLSLMHSPFPCTVHLLKLVPDLSITQEATCMSPSQQVMAIFGIAGTLLK